MKAPFDGRVIALNIRVGEQFGPSLFPGSQPPIVFCPEGELIARVEVDQERAYLVKPGQTVTLHDKSPSRKQQLTGTVERVARILRPRRGSAFEPDQMNDTRTCECIIRIKPDPFRFLIGQQMARTWRQTTRASGRRTFGKEAYYSPCPFLCHEARRDPIERVRSLDATKKAFSY